MPKPEKKERTKEELAELRKQMMKSKVTKKEDHFGGNDNSVANANPTKNLSVKDKNQKKSGKEPP